MGSLPPFSTLLFVGLVDPPFPLDPSPRRHPGISSQAPAHVHGVGTTIGHGLGAGQNGSSQDVGAWILHLAAPERLLLALAMRLPTRFPSTTHVGVLAGME